MLSSNALFGQTPGDSIAPRQIDTFTEMFKDSLQGKELLNFTAQQFNDEIIDLKRLKGNVIVLNFWFVGCPPCLGEVGDFNKVFNHFKDSSVKIISLANNTHAQIAKFIENKSSGPIEKIQYPIIPDASKIIKQYNVVSYPTTVFIDKKGVIRLVYSGALVSSLQKYVQFYGEKDLSKGWKKILKDNSDPHQIQMDAILIELIDDLLRE